MRKIPMVNINFGKDNILPKLNREDLAEIGKKESKPVLLKKSVTERNIVNHPDININKYNAMIGEALYNKDFIIKEKRLEKPNYYHFVKNNAVVLLDMDESKENYEIVHILTMRRRSLKRLKEKNS